MNKFTGYLTFRVQKEVFCLGNLYYFAIVNMDDFIAHSSCLVEIVSRHNNDTLATFFAHYCLLNYGCTVWVKVCCGFI